MGVSIVRVVKQVSKRVLTITAAGVMAFSGLALAAPMFFTGSAAAASDVVINEVSSNDSTDWAELYSPTGQDLSGWTVQFDASDSTSKKITLPSVTISAHGYYTVDASNNSWLAGTSGGTVKLFDGSSLIDSVSYGSDYSSGEGSASLPSGAQSLARTTNGGDSWHYATPTKNLSNDSAEQSVCATGCDSTTISGALANVDALGTVYVDAGTYAETVNVSKAVTFEGAQSGVAAASTSTGIVRGGSESTVNEFNITTSNVVVDGFSVADIRVDGPSTGVLSGLDIENNIFSGYNDVALPTYNAGGVAIQNNYFTAPANSAEAMQIKSSTTVTGCSNTQVLNNVFNGATSNGGSDINFSCTDSHSTGVSIIGNYSTGNSGGSSLSALSGVDSDITITGNTATTTGSSIFFAGNISGSVELDNNNFTNGDGYAVSIHGGDGVLGTDDSANSGTFTIVNNDLSGNVAAINIASGSLIGNGTVVANNNDLSGGTGGSDLTNNSAASVDATENYWGTSPDFSTLIGGTGRAKVTYTPYYINSARTHLNTALVRDVYVDPGYSASSAGGHEYGWDAFNTIQDAVDTVGAGSTIHAAAGTYNENVVVNKAVTLVGAGAATTTIAATDANHSPLTFATDGATVSGFTITHNYTDAEKSSWNFNNNGVTFNQLADGNTLENSTVALNRNGVYLNNSENNVVKDNLITNNRTGINMVNDLAGTQITGNVVSDNWTEGLVTYGSSIPVNYSLVTVSGNTFDNNWYEEVTVKDASANSGTLDVTNNTFTDSPVTYSTSSDASLNEPGFSAQRPVALGGTAAAPATALPTLRIYDSGSVALKYDNAKTINVLAGQSIQDAVDLASAGDTINVAAGTYNETVTISHGVSLVGANKASVINGGLYLNHTDGVVNISGFTFQNAGTISGDTASIVASHPSATINIDSNHFIGIGDNSSNPFDNAIWVYHPTVSGSVNITNNEFDHQWQSVLLERPIGGATLSGNNFHDLVANSAGTTSYEAEGVVALAYSGENVTNPVVISGNQFSSFSGKAIALSGGYPGETPAQFTDVQVENNQISLSGGDAITLRNAATTSADAATGGILDATVSGNTIASTASTGSAIYLQGANNNATVSGNTITGFANSLLSEEYVSGAGTSTGLTAANNLWNGGSPPTTLPVSGNQATTPATTTTLSASTGSGQVQVAIPANTTITANGGSWDGTIQAPTVTSVSLGSSKTVSLAIEVGASGVNLTFDNAVRLVLPGQAGKSVGFIRGGVFTAITDKCSADTQATGDALTAGGNCYINVGNDLVVWTKHFTTFVAYSSKSSGSGSSSSSSSSSSNGGSTTPTATSSSANNGSSAGQVKGQSTNVNNGKTSSLATKTPATASLSQPKAAAKEANGGGLRWYWYVLIAIAALALAAGVAYRYAEGTDEV